jgi:hypothetical protein
MLAFGDLLDRQVMGDPVERNIGLRAAKLMECGSGDVKLASHAGGGGQHTVCADEIGTSPDTLAGEPHCLVVVASDVLGV